jgi:hypothetical protein
MTKRYQQMVAVTLGSLTSDVSGMDDSITMFPNYQDCFQGYVGVGKNWPMWSPLKNLILMAITSHGHNRLNFKL